MNWEAHTFEYSYEHIEKFQFSVLDAAHFDMIVLVCMALGVAIYFIMLLYGMPTLYYYVSAKNEIKDKARKMGIANDLMLMRRIQTELEEDIKRQTLQSN